MKIINKNTYRIMYDIDKFIKADEVVDIDKKDAEKLLKHPNVEKYISEEENESLKKRIAELEGQLAASKPIEELKAEADALGIKYSKNIGAKKLQEKIDAAK